MVFFAISREINLGKFLPSAVQSLQSVLRNEEWIEKLEQWLLDPFISGNIYLFWNMKNTKNAQKEIPTKLKEIFSTKSQRASSQI